MSKNQKIYEFVTKKVLARLQDAIDENKNFHWVKGWSGLATANAIMWKRNNTRYRGINALLLDGLYITYKQLQEFQIRQPEQQFKIKKGCHQETVYFYKFSKIKEEVEQPDGSMKTETKTIPLMRFYNVFSINDIEGLSDYFKVDEYEHTLNEKMFEADKIIEDYCLRDNLKFDVVKGSDRCFYRPSSHLVNVPDKSQFKSVYEYYSSLFHELVHSSSKSLNRELGLGFGSEKYSKEELVAEIGSQMLMSYLGLDIEDTNVFDNSIAYLQGWLGHIKDSDVSFIVQEANQATKACDLILNQLYEASEEVA